MPVGFGQSAQQTGDGDNKGQVHIAKAKFRVSVIIFLEVLTWVIQWVDNKKVWQVESFLVLIIATFWYFVIRYLAKEEKPPGQQETPVRREWWRKLQGFCVFQLIFFLVMVILFIAVSANSAKPSWLVIKIFQFLINLLIIRDIYKHMNENMDDSELGPYGRQSDSATRAGALPPAYYRNGQTTAIRNEQDHVVGVPVKPGTRDLKVEDFEKKDDNDAFS